METYFYQCPARRAINTSADNDSNFTDQIDVFTKLSALIYVTKLNWQVHAFWYLANMRGSFL